MQIKKPSQIEEQGIIKSYEPTFELAWKTLKDFLESKEVVAKFPREVINSAFEYELISDGEKWLDMLLKRNLLSRVYDHTQAVEILKLIKENYLDLLVNLETFFIQKLHE